MHTPCLCIRLIPDVYLFLVCAFRSRTVEPKTVEDVCVDLSEPEQEDPATVDLPASDSGKGGYISYSITFSLLA